MPSFTLLFLVAAAICVVSQVALVRSGLRARPESTPDRSSRLKEVAWAILPAIVLGVVLVATWRAISPGAQTTPSQSISVVP
jgi:heme/copper-type cytochrome/quinol oxidase subunit 2